MIEQLLVDPYSKKALQLDYKKNTVYNLDMNKFYSNLDHQLITILPKTTKSSFNKSELHVNNNTTFEYIDHYSADANFFDYSNLYSNPITVDEIRRLHQTILNQVPKEAAIVLDVGCGSGWVSKSLTSEKKSVISMDISLTNPLNAIKNLPHKNHFGLVADAFNIPLKPNSLDCIIASEIMEHVTDPKVFIIKLLEVLKPNGTLIITTPFNEKINYHVCVNCNKPTPEHAHLHSFNFNNIKNIIPKNLAKVSARAFSNKPLIKLRLYFLIRKFPYTIWRVVDNFVNKIIKKPSRLMITIKK